MSRLHKKCVLGATTMHALLLLALLVGPAFFSKKEEPLNLQELTIIPDILTDKPFSKEGGASPGDANNPQLPQDKPAAQPATQPTPPTPEPPQKEEVVEPQPEKETKQPTKVVEQDEPKFTDRDSDKTPPKPKPAKHEVKVSTQKVKTASRSTSTTTKPATSSNSNSETSNNSALASAIRSTKSNLGSGLSSGTDVRMPAGQGGGSGASYANYAQAIQRIYKRAYDQALAAAGDIADGQTTIETSVVIQSDGTVASAIIASPSSNSALNSLTKRVLDSIRVVPPFPAGAKDSRRTFNIIFNLQPKNSLG